MGAHHPPTAVPDVPASVQRLEYGPFIIEVVAVDRLDLLEKNARFMKAETFRRLVDNIKQDGQVSQLPFCVPRGDRFLVLSGNHRVKGAQKAGLTELPIIYPRAPLTRDQELAIQLSHNAIAGEDDPTILKELWQELTTVDAKLYSGLDDKTMATLAAVSMPALAEVKLEFRTLSFLFLPTELPQIQQAFEAGRQQVRGDAVYLARFAEFDRLLDTLATVNAAHNIKNGATGLLVLLAIANRHLTDLAEGWFDVEQDAVRHKGWVPLSTILGGDTLPAEAAAVLKRAVDKLVGEGDVKPESRWRALELLAAEYLGGV